MLIIYNLCVFVPEFVCSPGIRVNTKNIRVQIVAGTVFCPVISSMPKRMSVLNRYLVPTHFSISNVPSKSKIIVIATRIGAINVGSTVNINERPANAAQK